MKLKKKEGNVVDYVIYIFGILALCIFFAFSVEAIKEMSKYGSANLVARNYIIKIESHGYLSAENAQKLEESLEDLGFTNITLSGTTMTEVNNGDDIKLIINCDQPIKKFKLNGFNLEFQKAYQSETISLYSTAKN